MKNSKTVPKKMTVAQIKWYSANEDYNRALKKFSNAEIEMARARQAYAKAHRELFGIKEPEFYLAD